MTGLARIFLAISVCVAGILGVGVAQRNTTIANPHASSDAVAEGERLSSNGVQEQGFVRHTSTSAGGDSAGEQTEQPKGDSEKYPVNVRQPAGAPRIELAGVDPQGRLASVACSTCHAVRTANLQNVSAATLDEFHQEMTFQHGQIACYSCHHPDNADALRLADGTTVGFENVLTLCSQCHGSQATAFAHGAHGGMNGHWDLSRGPQTKNNCIDCHDPHAPSYPKMIVGFKPKDRFNAPLEHGDSAQREDARTGAAPHGDR